MTDDRIALREMLETRAAAAPAETAGPNRPV
jgi:hypothetical protein